jgi:hypothetical protein
MTDSCFLNITYSPDPKNRGAASDRHTLRIETKSNPFEVNGKDVERLELTIAGNCELADLIAGMKRICDQITDPPFHPTPEEEQEGWAAAEECLRLGLIP